ncbi:hypothetical protein LIPSTDRAFT_163417 [Lipomyces starkeyi NRRL Y-11557]|uniref:Uncharacterized protein n=1 Tax=Lipomyces starkeyi NRRL Y-11557 TaxID=675824 RepID=A0A1E3PZX6_LIPST|nr:hypothetical protein LIPSTDRAFT_163417 [Lipomyces starkeyi NRRL Y-11557]
MLGTIFYRSYSIVPDSPEFAGLDDGFSGGILERTPFKFDEELGDDDHDYLAAVRVPRPAHPGVVGRGRLSFLFFVIYINCLWTSIFRSGAQDASTTLS